MCGLDVCLWCLIYVVNRLMVWKIFRRKDFHVEDDDVSQMFSVPKRAKEPISFELCVTKSNDDVDADKGIFFWGKVTNFQMPAMSFVQKRNLPEYLDML